MNSWLLKILIIGSGLVSLSGCSTVSMRAPGAPAVSEYAPENERKHMPGIVTYMTSGADWVVADRRETAYKKMFTVCNGSYEIFREYPSSSATSYVTSGMSNGNLLTSPMSYQYLNIVFDCL